MTPSLRAALLIAALTTAACTSAPQLPVVAARDLGVLETSEAFRGRDGGYSGVFRGRSVWLYGDSILAFPGEDGSSWRHNSWSWTEDFDAADGITGFTEPVDSLEAPREFFPQTAAEREFNDAHSEAVMGEDCAEPCGARRVLWPGPLVSARVDGTETAFVFYTKIYGEPGPWNFHGLGCGVAVWTDWDAGPTRPEVRPGAEEPTLLWDAEDGDCVAAAVVEDDLLYAWTCGGGLDKPCRLARMPTAGVTELEAWSWYAGSGSWSADRADAVKLFSGMDMTTVHWNPTLERWLAVYSAPLENKVKVRTAEHPEGPWSDAALAFRTEKPTDDSDWAYSGLGHAEHMGPPTGETGRFEYVTYYRGTGPFAGEVRLVELELEAP